MLSRTLILSGLAFAAVVGAARAETPPQKSIDDLCAERACRTGGYEVAVRINDKHYTTVPIGRSPYVTEDGDILIYPGETLAFQFAVDGDKLRAPTFVKAFSAQFPASIATEDSLSDNPADATLPKIPEGLSGERMAILPENTLLVSYGQYGDDSGMIMELDQNLTQKLKLDATMFLIEKNAYDQQYTSTCPIYPGHSVMEFWPHEIGPIVLSNFRFLKDSDDMACK
ncbi:hypothetical protein [Asticcacaulis sp. AC402]|uniref:hypothetical protein n=1 Tax=Asticcacaulis sp. AC402 TaxID=1282361 RepID=UPI0003C3D5EE|nr:hypothetical protein [Asticcacaulis sp. AC402]ESQ74456.1 hypothetical protein ABAC402_14150 [Asticcacaulis sp. AC402]